MTELRRVFRNDFQHWCEIVWRAGDDAQNLTRRCLLLQRFFQFLKQPHVFNRDDGLVGEGFDKGNLSLGERFYYVAPNYDYPDG